MENQNDNLPEVLASADMLGSDLLLGDIRSLIEGTKSRVARAINSEIVLL